MLGRRRGRSSESRQLRQQAPCWPTDRCLQSHLSRQLEFLKEQHTESTARSQACLPDISAAKLCSRATLAELQAALDAKDALISKLKVWHCLTLSTHATCRLPTTTESTAALVTASEARVRSSRLRQRHRRGGMSSSWRSCRRAATPKRSACAHPWSSSWLRSRLPASTRWAKGAGSFAYRRAARLARRGWLV